MFEFCSPVLVFCALFSRVLEMSSRQASTSYNSQSSSTIPDGYVTREDFQRLISLVETSFNSIHAKIDRLTAEVAEIKLAITRLDGPHGNGPEAQPREAGDTFTKDTSEGRTLDETTNEKDTPGLTPERKAGTAEGVPNALGARRKLQYKDGNQDRAKEQLVKIEEPSQKHLKFVKEPIGEKTVFELPGIAKVLGGKLEKKRFGRAKDVLEQFRRLNGDENKFLNWIKEECGANKKQGGDCYRCLKEWCENHSSQS